MKEQTQPKQTITRRNFLVGAAAGLALIGCGSVTRNPSSTLDTTATTGLPESTLPVDSLPGTEVEPAGTEFSITGVPEQVSSSNLDIAKGDFLNLTGLGSESFIAEPGSLLVGPNYLFNHPDATFAEIEAKVNGSHGHIEYFSPVNQQVFETEGASFFDLPEGGYIFASAGQMDVTFKGIEVKLPAQEAHNYFLIVRGIHADGQQDSDLNETAQFTNYVPGHIEVERYPAGDAGFEGGFISEEQFYQKAEASRTGETNCGAEGCSRLTAVFVDANTGAYTVMTRTDGNAWAQLATNIVA